jgi:hypothetical protein
LAGTKCNKLLRIAAHSSSAAGTRSVLSIPLPARPPPPRVSAARRAATAAAAAFLRTLRGGARGGGGDDDALLPPLVEDAEQPESCGIHAIAVSPSRRHVITGGDNPCDVALLDGATLERRALCMVRTHARTQTSACARARAQSMLGFCDAMRAGCSSPLISSFFARRGTRTGCSACAG